MKTIGVIGGFGPEATAQFYLKIVDVSRMRHHGAQPPIILRNVSVPSVMERDALLHGKNMNKFIPFLTHAAKELELAGADFIVLPCNTLHIHEASIRKGITIPFVSIIDATMSALRTAHIKRIGLLGSRVTVQRNLFRQQSDDVGFVLVPNTLQADINFGLNLFVESNDDILLRKALKKACMFMKRHQVRDVLLACTDFNELCPKMRTIHVHDTLNILVEATVNML